MACFGVHAERDGNLVVDVQSDLVEILNPRVVAPLIPPGRGPIPARRLNPLFEVEGTPLVFVARYIAALPAAELGRPLGALDMARLGF
jgi:toxin CcdB